MIASQSQQHPLTPVGRDPRRRRVTADHRLAAVGRSVVASVFLIGSSFAAGALVVQAIRPAFLSASQMRSVPLGTPGQPETGKTQSALVERRSGAVAAYAAKLAEFKAATARQPGAAGINLDAAEARRREGVLAGLVLDCINAVNQYNLAAEEPSVSQRRAAGLPVRFEWAVDCNVGQERAVLGTNGSQSSER